MKQFITVIALAVLVLLMPQPGHAVPFTTTLDGLSEFPPNASPGTGSATVDLDVIAHTLSVSITFSGLIGNTTAAHIHCCVSPPGNIGVATMTPTFVGFPLGVTSGTYISPFFDTTLASTFSGSFIAASGGTVAGAEAALLAGLLAGNAYVNIHTNVFPGGEIRGFLQPASVPEPATFLLLASGLAGMAVLRRKFFA